MGLARRLVAALAARVKIPGAARYRNITGEANLFDFLEFYFAQVVIFVYLIINFFPENRASYCHFIAA
jgi:hypothetical protein